MMLNPIILDTVKIECPILLAPLSGISDVPFREAVLQYWAGMVYSEMIAARRQIQDVKGSLKMIQKAKNQQYSAVQIAGYEPYYITEAVKINTDLGADIIDLNFGCPAKKIVTNVAGSALMHPDNLARAKDIIQAAVKATHLPVTLKMRLGWDHDHLTGCILAKIAQDCGIKMLTVHGRTRKQFYTGYADWQAIYEIRQATTLPLIVNGDIIDLHTARDALKQSGADGIMVGRATCGRPWLLQQLKTELCDHKPYNLPQKEILIDNMVLHYQHIINFYGEKKGIAIGRKHLHWYREALSLNDDLKNIINHASQSQDVVQALMGMACQNIA